jgi:hypothetical protein
VALLDPDSACPGVPRIGRTSRDHLHDARGRRRAPPGRRRDSGCDPLSGSAVSGSGRRAREACTGARAHACTLGPARAAREFRRQPSGGAVRKLSASGETSPGPLDRLETPWARGGWSRRGRPAAAWLGASCGASWQASRRASCRASWWASWEASCPAGPPTACRACRVPRVHARAYRAHDAHRGPGSGWVLAVRPAR